MARKSRSLYDEIGQAKTVYVEPYEKPRGRSHFTGGKYMLTGLLTYKIVRELRLPSTARIVLDWLCEHVEYGNTVNEWTQNIIADDCGLYRPRVSIMMRLLEQHSLVLVLGRGLLILNPYLWYRGELREQAEACERWDMHMAKRGKPAKPVAVAAEA